MRPLRGRLRECAASINQRFPKGFTKSYSSVNEMVIMVVAWIMTIPCTAAMGGRAYMILTSLFGGAL